MRRLWRRLFGPRPRPAEPSPADSILSSDWCCVCLVDLFEGEVWEVRQHMTPTGDEDGVGGSWIARTYCAEHAPADALAPISSTDEQG